MSEMVVESECIGCQHAICAHGASCETEPSMSDLFIELTYDINNPDDFKINTNVKHEKVCDLLCEWIRGQMGKGADKSPPNEDTNIYHIRIEVDLSYDIFTTKSDTGNKSLTAGIVGDVVKRLPDEYRED